MIRHVGSMVFVVLLLLGGRSGAEESSPKMRAKQLLAARSAAEGLIEGRDQMGADSGGSTAVLIEKRLHDAMLDDSKTHADPKESRGLCRERTNDEVLQALNVLEVNVLESAAQHSPLPVSREVLFDSVGVSRESFRKAALEHYAERHADRLFTQARKRAVERQLRETSLRVGYPPQDHLNVMLSEIAEKKPAKPLRRADILSCEQALEENLGIDKLVLLSEVRTRLSQLALQVLGEIADQYAGQADALKKAADASETAALVSSERIAARLLSAAASRVEQDRSEPNRDAATTLYDVFACVRLLVEAQSLELEKRFLSLHAAGTDCMWPTDVDIDKTIRADIKGHRASEASRTLLRDAFQAEAARRIVTGYVEGGGIPDGSRDALVQRLVAHVTDDEACRKAFEASIQKRLDAGATAVRETISAMQAEDMLAELASVERLGERTVDWLYETERLGVFKSLEAAEEVLRSKEGLRVRAVLESPRLEEADALLLERLNALVVPAEVAHKKQRSLIQKLAREWQNALKQDVAEGVSLSSIRKRWRAEIDARYTNWVASAASVYVTLFPSSVAELEKVLRQHYVSVVESQSVEVKTTEKAMDATQEIETDQRPTEIEEKKLNVPDDEESSAASDSGGSEAVTPMEEALMFARRAPVSLVLSDIGPGSCELRVSYGELGRQRAVQFAPDAADAAVDTIVGGVDPKTLLEALSLRRPRKGFLGIGRRSPDPVDVVVVVESRQVRYRTMVRVREHLGALLEEVSKAEGLDLPEMEWTAASEMPSE
ncbi:MAG: hypothetical protein HN341_13590 [Verrucomicrobia bacterium]|jgi:hypothetical protein|nr:hypothetical protein [Verrucomicrobiota bacterium]